MSPNFIRVFVLIGLVTGLFAGNMVTAQEENDTLRVATKLFPPLVVAQGRWFCPGSAFSSGKQSRN